MAGVVYLEFDATELARDLVNEFPHSAAGVRPRGSAVAEVLVIERNGSGLGVWEPLGQLLKRVIVEDLVALEQLLGECLGGVPLNMGGVVLEVEDEPEFDARVGHGHADTVGEGLLHGGAHIRMLVDVEHAPVLIAGAPTSALCLPGFVALLLDSVVDDRHRERRGPLRCPHGRGRGGPGASG